jgi:hypothetical protein
VKLRDLRDDQPLSLPDAAAYLGKMTGQKPHVSTMWRWCLKGCKGVVLESICIGGKRFVTAASIDRFIEASTAASQPSVAGTMPPQPASSPAPRSPLAQVMRHNNRRREEIEAARRRLDEITGTTKRTDAPAIRSA